MNNDFRVLLDELNKFDLSVTPRFWESPKSSAHEMRFREWKDFVLASYGSVSDSYAKKMYENVVLDQKTNQQTLVQLRLCDVFNKVEGTVFEQPVRRAVMKCVYSDRRFDRELKPVMDAFYAEGNR